MPNHHHVHPHGLNILRRVDEGLALAEAGAAGREIDGVGTQTLGSQAKACPGPRGGLEKEVDDYLAVEVLTFLTPSLADVHEVFGRVENRFQLGSTQVFE